MKKEQIQKINQLKEIEVDHAKAWIDYWIKYSSFDDWQFWVILGFLIVPLIFLFFFMDRSKSLLLGFYGYNVHVFFTYIDLFGTNNTYWFYPYKLLPILPSSFALDAVFVPVSYIFVYQWALNHNKNYYLSIIGLSIILAFVIKPIMEALRLVQFDKGANFLHLLFGYILVGIVAKQVTNLFLYLQNKSHKSVKS
ncbi:CBO0543 family protein [Neobacillus cucumis]|uniref:CBO0543 family protein n=1 Tax=Neobacillus cucumis TaxID=1740721 RepID=UPI0028531E64|nr:CBO0543 family protein [Neobacillus cucumis]MDR4948102.1 CBO0543 family protein [Neobacillus cucumis]